MPRLIDRLKHAFAVEKEDSLQPTDPQREVVDLVCREVAKRRLTTPALLFLEMCRPLNFYTAQMMHYFQPIVSIVLDTRGYQIFAEFLEHRGSIGYMCRRIEHFEQEFTMLETRPTDDGQPDAPSSGQPR